jgi:hypothetical protein
MTDHLDPTAVLEKLRPVTAVDDDWPASARDAALARLLASGDPSAAPRRPRRRRILLTATLTAGLVASGAGVAAAGGLLPESFAQNLSFWTSETAGRMDVQTARRVAQTPGPDGRVLSVWSARSGDGAVCVSAVFESPGPLDRPAPANFRSGGGSCLPPHDTWGPFGSGGGTVEGNGIHIMSAADGGAVRGELRLADGSVSPVAHAAGMFFYWYRAGGGVTPPTLVGYDAAGKVLGEQAQPDLTGPLPVWPTK